jgi:hypothetical protein
VSVGVATLAAAMFFGLGWMRTSSPAGRAQAQSIPPLCSAESGPNGVYENIQQGDRTATDQYWQKAAGIQGEDTVNARDYNTKCDGVESGTDMMIRFVDANGNRTGSFLKVGYELSNDFAAYQSGPTAKGSENYYFRWEAKFPGADSTHISDGYTYNCSPAINDCVGTCGSLCPLINGIYAAQGVGALIQFRIANIGGTDWALSLDEQDGGGNWSGWHRFATVHNTGFTDGVPEGEDYRYGGTATGMSDEQFNLEFQDDSGTWHTWFGNKCYSDNASNWKNNNLTIDSWQTEKGTPLPGSSCPG